MLVKFQIIHKLDEGNFSKIVNSAVSLINGQIIIDYPPYDEDCDIPVSYSIIYNIKHKNCSLSGVLLDFFEYTQSYYGDYDSTISMGFEWGAGSAIDEFIKYLSIFIESIKSNNDIIQIIKYNDSNLQNAYWLHIYFTILSVT